MGGLKFHIQNRHCPECWLQTQDIVWQLLKTASAKRRAKPQLDWFVHWRLGLAARGRVGSRLRTNPFQLITSVAECSWRGHSEIRSAVGWVLQTEATKAPSWNTLEDVQNLGSAPLNRINKVSLFRHEQTIKKYHYFWLGDSERIACQPCQS